MAKGEKIFFFSTGQLLLLLAVRLPLEDIKEIVPFLILYGGISGAGAAVTLLLDKQVRVTLRLKTAFAGIILGLLMAFILRDSLVVTEIMREGIAASCGLFTDLIWRKWEDKVSKKQLPNEL